MKFYMHGVPTDIENVFLNVGLNVEDQDTTRSG